MRRLIFLVVTLAIVPALLFAADAGRTSALFMAPLAAGAGDPLVEDILASELGAALLSRGIAVAPRRLSLATGADQPKLPGEQRLSYLLRGLDAGGVSVVVAAFYLVQGDTLVIQFALYDPAVRTMLGGVLARARKGLTLFASVSEAVLQFDPAIQRYVLGGYQVEPPTGIVERIQVSGPPDGSSVVLLDREVGTIAGGTLVVPYTQFEIGSKIPVRVTKEGYHTFEGIYELSSSQVSLSLPSLRRETRLDTDLFWSFGEALGPVKIFFRPELHYALGVGYNLLGRTWIRTPYGLPPLTVGVRYSW
jgi:hypothetical protein